MKFLCEQCGKVEVSCTKKYCKECQEITKQKRIASGYLPIFLARTKFPCERCSEIEAVLKEKYCKECKEIVKQQMIEDNYLQSTGDAHIGQRRTQDKKENTYETKFGTWQR